MKRKAKPFLMYCPQYNELLLIQNDYGFHIKYAKKLVLIGLKSGITLEYIGLL